MRCRCTTSKTRPPSHLQLRGALLLEQQAAQARRQAGHLRGRQAASELLGRLWSVAGCMGGQSAQLPAIPSPCFVPPRLPQRPGKLLGFGQRLLLAPSLQERAQQLQLVLAGGALRCVRGSGLIQDEARGRRRSGLKQAHAWLPLNTAAPPGARPRSSRPAQHAAAPPAAPPAHPRRWQRGRGRGGPRLPAPPARGP